ncbi:hypothetical protein ACFQ9J_27140 [Streptomyces sp. NPDC056529]|uniref:hypothetical protein n=1 Tax=Streptomyces sp. NPDC056529 TaxID=3345855 RepID=UPI003695E135
MTEPIKQDPIITTKDMHATSEPAVGSITAKITGSADAGVTTKDMHATSEPAVESITAKITGDAEHVAKPAN